MMSLDCICINHKGLSRYIDSIWIFIFKSLMCFCQKKPDSVLFFILVWNCESMNAQFCANLVDCAVNEKCVPKEGNRKWQASYVFLRKQQSQIIVRNPSNCVSLKASYTWRFKLKIGVNIKERVILIYKRKNVWLTEKVDRISICGEEKEPERREWVSLHSHMTDCADDHARIYQPIYWENNQKGQILVIHAPCCFFQHEILSCKDCNYWP